MLRSTPNRLDPVEPRLVLARHGAADGDRLLLHAVVEIVPDRRLEFRLVAGLFQHFRIDVGDAAEGAVVGRSGNAALASR